MRGKYYPLRQQRLAFIQTIQNDLVLKAIYKREKHFEQVGAGRTAFKHLWDYVLFRAAFCVILPFVMLSMDIYQPLHDAVKLLFYKKKKLTSKRLFVGYSRRLYTITKQANLQKDGDYWMRLENQTYVLPEAKPTVTVFDFVTFGDIAKAAVQAPLIHLRTVFSLGYEKYFLSYNAYEWCLTDYALRHVSEDTELVYCFICDRNAILLDQLPHKMKSMVQHGTMHFSNVDTKNPYMEYHPDKGFYIWASLYRSSPSTVYCYTDDDEWALSNSVIANHPKYIKIGYGFKPAFKPNNRSLLIVGHYNLFSEKEEYLLSHLQNTGIDIFLKNHPAINNALYDDLRAKYSFNFIDGTDTKLPEVDLVVSYDSTLAYEYASIGAKVLYYGQNEVDKIVEEIKKQLLSDNEK